MWNGRWSSNKDAILSMNHFSQNVPSSGVPGHSIAIGFDPDPTCCWCPWWSWGKPKHTTAHCIIKRDALTDSVRPQSFKCPWSVCSAVLICLCGKISLSKLSGTAEKNTFIRGKNKGWKSSPCSVAEILQHIFEKCSTSSKGYRHMGECAGW